MKDWTQWTLEGAVNDEVSLSIQEGRTVVVSAYARTYLNHRYSYNLNKWEPKGSLCLAKTVGLRIETPFLQGRNLGHISVSYITQSPKPGIEIKGFFGCRSSRCLGNKKSFLGEKRVVFVTDHG